MSKLVLSGQLLESPVPVWLLTAPEDAHVHFPCSGFLEIAFELDEVLFACDYRGLNIERITDVLSFGIDVSPTDSVIWAGDFAKAWEYAEWPKLIIALQPKALRKTYVDVSADLPQDEIAAIQAVYPERLESRDGSRLRFSKLDDVRAGSGYENAHAFWIPGDPFDASRAAFVVARPSDDLDGLIRVMAS